VYLVNVTTSCHEDERHIGLLCSPRRYSSKTRDRTSCYSWEPVSHDFGGRVVWRSESECDLSAYLSQVCRFREYRRDETTVAFLVREVPASSRCRS
jgi:hypothetical protein